MFLLATGLAEQLTRTVSSSTLCDWNMFDHINLVML